MVAPLHGAVKVIKGEVGCRSSAIEVYAGPSDSRLLVYHVFTTIAPHIRLEKTLAEKTSKLG